MPCFGTFPFRGNNPDFKKIAEKNKKVDKRYKVFRIRTDIQSVNKEMQQFRQSVASLLLWIIFPKVMYFYHTYFGRGVKSRTGQTYSEAVWVNILVEIGIDLYYNNDSSH